MKATRKVLSALIAFAMILPIFCGFAMTAYAEENGHMHMEAVRDGDAINLNIIIDEEINFGGMGFKYNPTCNEEGVFTYNTAVSDVTGFVFTPGPSPMWDNAYDTTLPAGTTLMHFVYDIDTTKFTKGTEYTFTVMMDMVYPFDTDNPYGWGYDLVLTATYKEEKEEEDGHMHMEAVRDGDAINLNIIIDEEINFGGMGFKYNPVCDVEGVFTYNTAASDVTGFVFTPGPSPMWDNAYDTTLPAGTTLMHFVYDIDTTKFQTGTEYTFSVMMDMVYPFDTDNPYEWGYDLVLTATYKEEAPATHTVKFVDWDGTELKVETVEHGAAATAPADPTREGYTFTGWDPADFSNITADLTVTAQYTINTYTVKFVDWDGTELKTETVNYGEAATAPANPTREGYTFTGWDPADFSNITADLTVTAQYRINKYRLCIYYLNQANEMAIASAVMVDVEYGAEYSYTSPTITGYHLVNEEQAVISGVMGAGKVEIDVYYAINTYTVKFVDHDGTVLKAETVNYGGAATAPADPTREGYTFTGWDKAFNNVTEDLTVTAQYTINTYTVKFVDHDGTELKVETVNYGEAATAPADPTREGYTFTGWDPADFSNITADLTVTAQYTINTYTLTIHYVDEEGSELYPDYTDTLEYQATYSVTSPTSIAYYEPNIEVVTGTVGTENIEVTVVYVYNAPYEPVPPTVSCERPELREREEADGKFNICFNFKVTFNDSCVDYKGTKVGPTTEYYEVTGIGAILKNGSHELTVNCQNIYSMGDDSFIFNIVLRSIPETAAATQITACPNITYVLNGVSETVEGEPIVISVNDLNNAD